MPGRRPIAPEYLTVQEAALLLRCSEDTILRNVACGRILAVRYGRVIRIARSALLGVAS